MDHGIEITGWDRENEHISLQYFQIDALSVRFGEAYQSFYMVQLYIMIRLSVLVSPVLFLPRAPLQEDSSDVSCCRYRYHGVAYLSLNFRILQHQAFIKPLQGF